MLSPITPLDPISMIMSQAQGFKGLVASDLVQNAAAIGAHGYTCTNGRSNLITRLQENIINVELFQHDGQGEAGKASSHNDHLEGSLVFGRTHICVIRNVW